MADKVESLSELNDKYLMCRAKGHHWEHITDKVLASSRGVPREVRRFWRCRCSTGMQELIAVPSFEVKSRTYDYPDGYGIRTPDSSRVRAWDVRREQFVRLGIVKPTIRRVAD